MLSNLLLSNLGHCCIIKVTIRHQINFSFEKWWVSMVPYNFLNQIYNFFCTNLTLQQFFSNLFQTTVFYANALLKYHTVNRANKSNGFLDNWKICKLWSTRSTTNKIKVLRSVSCGVSLPTKAYKHVNN